MPEVLYERNREYIPRIAAVHDMCGYGKCSLPAAIPILSAAGCDVCPVPTALFSAHTRYKVFTMEDTTDMLGGYLDAWQQEGVELDGVYSGFLGSPDQVAIIQRLYREYPKSIPQYGEDEERKTSRSSSVIKKILIVLAIFFALSVVFAIVSGMLNKRGSSTADTTAEQTESASSGTVDLSDIPGQYWSNAKKLLKSRGADLSNAVILTDDGSTPVVDANWVVTSAYYNDNGNLEIQLTHKNSSGNSSDGQSGTDSSSSNALEDLSNKAQELGDKAQELGDTAQNLGDTAQNLGGMATDAWNALQNGISGAQGN